MLTTMTVSFPLAWFVQRIMADASSWRSWLMHDATLECGRCVHVGLGASSGGTFQHFVTRAAMRATASVVRLSFIWFCLNHNHNHSICPDLGRGRSGNRPNESLARVTGGLTSYALQSITCCEDPTRHKFPLHTISISDRAAAGDRCAGRCGAQGRTQTTHKDHRDRTQCTTQNLHMRENLCSCVLSSAKDGRRRHATPDACRQCCCTVPSTTIK